MRLFTCLVSMFWLLFFTVSGQTLPHNPIEVRKDFYANSSRKTPSSYKTISISSRDLAEHQRKSEGSPLVSMPIPLSFTMKNAGNWVELESGYWAWTLKMKLPGAKATAIFFDHINIASGSFLYVYGDSKREIKGPFSSDTMGRDSMFWAGITDTDSVSIEFFEPLSMKGTSDFRIFRADYVYDVASASGFGASLECHENINCEQGNEWQDEKRGIVKVTMVLEEGIGFCTGNLMNNTMEDETPYILTGFHCQDGFTPLYSLWFFDFNFEFKDCAGSSTAPSFLSMVGCLRRAGRRENDMLLLELNNDIPASFGVYFLGWDRSTTAPATTVNIHHPLGDVKKITVINSPATIFNGSIQWNNDVITPSMHHFRINYNTGTFEVGSSGSALLNGTSGRVAGQLHGGQSGCDATLAYFARLALSWDGGGTPETRLKDWLDPLGQSPMTLDGHDTMQSGGTTVSGSVKLENGDPVPGVLVQLVGTVTATAVTDQNGNFVFEQVPLNQAYLIDIDRSDETVNGLSVLDVIRIRKHVQQTELLDSPYKIISADVDNSNSISVLDIIRIQKVILNLETNFDSVANWRFIPQGFAFTDPKNPFSDTIPGNFVINNLSGSISNVNFIALKSGDIDSSVKLE